MLRSLRRELAEAPFLDSNLARIQGFRLTSKVYQMAFVPNPFRRRGVVPFMLVATLAVALSRPSIAQTAPLAPSSPSVLATPATPATELQNADRLLRRREPVAALAAVDRHLKTDPDSAPARFLRGVILADLKRDDEAVAVFTALTREYPELPEPYNNLAVFHANAGAIDKARQALEQSLAANPNNAVAQENLGDVYARLAAQAYQRALDSAAPTRGLRNKLQVVRSLTGSLTTTDKLPVTSNGGTE